LHPERRASDVRPRANVGATTREPSAVEVTRGPRRRPRRNFASRIEPLEGRALLNAPIDIDANGRLSYRSDPAIASAVRVSQDGGFTGRFPSRGAGGFEGQFVVRRGRALPIRPLAAASSARPAAAARVHTPWALHR